MLESTVELLGGLCLSALTLLIGFLYCRLDCCGTTSG
jgi:hypothetical protein